MAVRQGCWQAAGSTPLLSATRKLTPPPGGTTHRSPHDIFLSSMYSDFKVEDRWTGQEIHFMYQAIIMAIATRHADAVDIKFLANGRPVWIALPHAAWA